MAVKKVDKEKGAKKETNSLWILIVGIITIVLLWLWNLIILPRYYNNFEQSGQFGDMFGAVNSLFSGLAFSFLAYTVWQQHKELRLQRREFQLQRKEFELQRRAQQAMQKDTEAQAKHLETQAQNFTEQLELFRQQLKVSKEDQELREKELSFQQLQLLPSFQISKDLSHFSFESAGQTLVYQLTLYNTGATTPVVYFDAQSDRGSLESFLQPKKFETWGRGERKSISLRIPSNYKTFVINLQISYFGFRNQELVKEFQITRDQNTNALTFSELD